MDFSALSWPYPYYDEHSSKLGNEHDSAALLKADAMPGPKWLKEIENSFAFKSPVNVVLTDHEPEWRFTDMLTRQKNAVALRSWVKAPDTGFYEIEYAHQEGGTGRSKRGKFNPDFFLWLDDADVVTVVEVKSDGDSSWRNKGKMLAARTHFDEVNQLLAADGQARRYVVHIITPRDYDKFFEALRNGTPDQFHSELQGVLDGMRATAPGGNGAQTSPGAA